MKFVVPAKLSSLRVKEKNFRPFADGKSLLDVTLEKLLKIAKPSDIFVSCECRSKQTEIEAWGVNFILRAPELCDNDTPIFDYFNGIVDDVPGSDDIAWCQVIDPLFDEYDECINEWNRHRSEHDSLVVVYPIRKYLLDPTHSPIGFGFGRGHIKSQMLPTHFELTFTLAILKREAVRQHGHWVGSAPLWYHATGSHVDIDTQEEFELAAEMFRRRTRVRSSSI